MGMTARSRDVRHRRWLRDAARRVAKLLREQRGTGIHVYPVRHIDTWETDTDGWAAGIGRLRQPGGGGLGIWLDGWWRFDSRRLSACFETTRDDRLRQIAEAGKSEFGPATTLRDSDYETSAAGAALVGRLPLKILRRPIVEAYTKSGSLRFYTLCFPEAINYSVPAPESWIHRIALFFDRVARSDRFSERQLLTQESVYPDFPNRSRVVTHVQRERSSRHARDAKKRDKYVCRVCGFHFERFYGRIGAKFAEAHHVVPLSSKMAPATTRIDDLITVCSNCHAMLHKMKGRESDVEQLRSLLT
jgi:5-methylcytosine-specific restriction endonuclease McrA